MEAFFHYKSFLLSTKFTLKTERDATSTEKQIANVFCNRFVNVTKSWNIPEVNPQKARIIQIMIKFLKTLSSMFLGYPGPQIHLYPFSHQNTHFSQITMRFLT